MTEVNAPLWGGKKCSLFDSKHVLGLGSKPGGTSNSE
jgi:hypothetical protein